MSPSCAPRSNAPAFLALLLVLFTACAVPARRCDKLFIVAITGQAPQVICLEAPQAPRPEPWRTHSPFPR